MAGVGHTDLFTELEVLKDGTIQRRFPCNAWLHSQQNYYLSWLLAAALMGPADVCPPGQDMICRGCPVRMWAMQDALSHASITTFHAC